MITTTTALPPAFPPSPSPSPSPLLSPSPSPAPSAVTVTAAPPLPPPQTPTTATNGINFSPPLIAMVVIIATAFLLITYSRTLARYLLLTRRRITIWRRRHRRRRRHSFLPSTSNDDSFHTYDESPFTTDGFHVSSPYGLDESIIKTIPLSLYNSLKNDTVVVDCAVCLLEFEDGECIRTLPVCSHSFHVECIDVWLRSHANCPLCRAGIIKHNESPLVPVMSSRIRPSLDDVVLDPMMLSRRSTTSVTEIVEEQISPMRSNVNFSNGNSSNMLLKRSYSFGFERSIGRERLLLEPVTASPWRYRRGFWSKRTSPFGLLTKPSSRVFSFRGMKSPFFRRKMFFPSESRRSKSLTSPRFVIGRYNYGGTTAFSSSRLRCGDPEALLSPERFNRR